MDMTGNFCICKQDRNAENPCGKVSVVYEFVSSIYFQNIEFSAVTCLSYKFYKDY